MAAAVTMLPVKFMLRVIVHDQEERRFDLDWDRR
jgi:hypothetical protein